MYLLLTFPPELRLPQLMVPVSTCIKCQVSQDSVIEFLFVFR